MITLFLERLRIVDSDIRVSKYSMIVWYTASLVPGLHTASQVSSHSLAGGFTHKLECTGIVRVSGKILWLRGSC